MSKPNLIYIFADQWRARAVSYEGDKNVKTPYIDSLSEMSISFTNAISNCPICTPHRASLLTGQYPLTTGVFMNDLCLSNKAVSIATAYTNAGYDTAYIGKWHIDGHGRDTYIPRERRQGFDYFKVLECTHDYNNSCYYDGDDEKIKKWEGYDAFAQTKDAINYLKNRRGNSKPFILMLSFGTPHNPYETAPKEYLDMYDKEKIKLQPNVLKEFESEAKIRLQGYYAHISALDDCVKEIDEAIRELDLMDNTILVLTSDHGDSVMSHCDIDIGSVNKQRPYDESVRVPFLLRYPKKFGYTSRIIDNPFATPDIMPTLLELSGIEIPKTVEGISYVSALTEKEELKEEGALIASYVPFADWSPDRGGMEYRGIVTKRYTYTRNLKGPWLLFDNKNDPYQLKNLVDDPNYDSIKIDLENKLKTILMERDDAFLSSGLLLSKYGYHSIDKRTNAILINKGQEWFDKAEQLKKKNI